MSFLFLCVGCSIGFAAGSYFGKKRAEIDHAIYVMRTNAYVERCAAMAKEIEQRLIERNAPLDYPAHIHETKH
jgi:hypothetical protein